MNPPSHYAERAWSILLESDDHENMERLFAEAQADALRYAADQIPAPSLIYTASKLRAEADCLLQEFQQMRLELECLKVNDQIHCPLCGVKKIDK